MSRMTIFMISAVAVFVVIGLVAVNLALAPQNTSHVLAAKPPTNTPKPPPGSTPTPTPALGIGIYSFLCGGCRLGDISLVGADISKA